MAALVDENSRKVFVGGLGSGTSQETLLSVFQSFGAVESATVIEYADKLTGVKRSRGFGFVIFADADAVQGAVAQHKIIIDGKECEIKGIDDQKSSAEGKAEIEKKKIFCGGLAETVDKEKLKAFFQQMDPDLVEARVMFDPVKARSRCFGYVTFSQAHFVDQAIANTENNIIDDKWVDVKACAGAAVQKKGKGKGKDAKGKGKGYDAYKGSPGYGAAPPPAYPPYAYQYPPPQPYYPQYPPQAYYYPPPAQPPAYGAAPPPQHHQYPAVHAPLPAEVAYPPPAQQQGAPPPGSAPPAYPPPQGPPASYAQQPPPAGAYQGAPAYGPPPADTYVQYRPAPY